MQLDRFALLFPLAALAAAPAAAQSQLASYEGTQVSEGLDDVAGGHDLNGDGVDDLVLGGGNPSGASLSGKVQAVSGATGSVIWTQFGGGGTLYGSALCMIPDLTGDGVWDVLVGAPALSSSSNPGELYVHSGATGALVFSRAGFQGGSRLGYSVAGDFDWDQDGVMDIAAGGPLYDGTDPDQGYIAVYSGQSGLLIDLVYGTGADHQFGYAMAGGGDFDGDGFHDLAVGSPTAGLGGKVRFLPGTSQIQPIHANARYGHSLVCLGDLSGEGKAEWLVGAPGRSSGAGSALIYGDDLTVFLPVGGTDDELGTAVANVGDVNLDGVNDMAVTATQGTTGGQGYVRVYSGKFQTLLYERASDVTGAAFGVTAAGVGDHNGDGYPDVAVGSPRYGETLFNQGRVEVFSGGGPGFVNYCTAGTSASGCTASISGLGNPSAVVPTPFQLTASGVEGDKRGLFFYGWNGRQANPWGTGSSFNCVVPPVKRTPLFAKSGTPGACDGQFSIDLNAYWQANPNKNPGAGAVAQAQFWHRDPANGSGQPTSLSNAIEFVVAP